MEYSIVLSANALKCYDQHVIVSVSWCDLTRAVKGRGKAKSKKQKAKKLSSGGFMQRCQGRWSALPGCQVSMPVIGYHHLSPSLSARETEEPLPPLMQVGRHCVLERVTRV